MAISFDWSETIAKLPSNPIPAEWLASKGKGVKVAFADTGANLGLASLKHLDKMGRKFFTSAPGFSVVKTTGQDMVGEAFGVAGSGHGTLYASLLAGKTPVPAPTDKDLVTGIANDADWYIIKATDDTGELTTVKNLLDALELSANLGIEIFITGQSIPRAEIRREGLDAEVTRVFNLPGVKKMFIFAPLLNLTITDSWEGVTRSFPNFFSEVCNVVTLPKNLASVAEVLQPQPIPFLLAGFKGEVLTKAGDAVEREFSNSAAVALMGGIATLALSVFKAQNGNALPDRNQFMQFIGNVCTAFDQNFNDFDTPTLIKKF